MSTPPLPGRFLTAEWRQLAMLNYEIDPAVLRSHVPAGTELDAWQGRTFVSMVGFLFLKTRLLGVPIPFHGNFAEVNLRFYVRRRGPEGWRRGVVFVKEIVPRWAIATVARLCYGERYAALPMRHQVNEELAAYEWRWAGEWNRLAVRPTGLPALPGPGSEEEFITEHYWGYARQRGGGTVEYRVEHPPWRVWQSSEALCQCAVQTLYGPEFQECLQGRPTSAFLAEGSPVTVRRGVTLAAS